MAEDGKNHPCHGLKWRWDGIKMPIINHSATPRASVERRKHVCRGICASDAAARVYFDNSRRFHPILATISQRAPPSNPSRHIKHISMSYLMRPAGLGTGEWPGEGVGLLVRDALFRFRIFLLASSGVSRASNHSAAALAASACDKAWVAAMPTAASSPPASSME